MSRYRERIERLAAEAGRARRATPVAADPDEERALAAARDGLGPVVSVYVEARAGDERVRFDDAELAMLDGATNDWLTCYARHRGYDHEAAVPVRTAAELLVDTHDVADVAYLLTRNPA